jgi:hypothetical protein
MYLLFEDDLSIFSPLEAKPGSTTTTRRVKDQ